MTSSKVNIITIILKSTNAFFVQRLKIETVYIGSLLLMIKRDSNIFIFYIHIEIKTDKMCILSHYRIYALNSKILFCINNLLVVFNIVDKY